MVRLTVTCCHCGSANLIRCGKTDNGKQRYECRDCGRRSRENPSTNAYAPERKAEILRAYQERSSLRGLQRTFGVSRQTVTGWLKKGAMNSPN